MSGIFYFFPFNCGTSSNVASVNAFAYRETRITRVLHLCENEDPVQVVFNS